MLLLLACASLEADPLPTPEPTSAARSLPAETDLPDSAEGRWTLQGGAALTLEPGGHLSLSDPPSIWEGVVGEPSLSAARDRAVFSLRVGGGPHSHLMAMDAAGGWQPRPLVERAASIDRPALSPDGEQVAYVSGETGITSVWWVPFEGGEPRQLTNAGLVRTPGQAPLGFVPPPHQGPPRFEGGMLVWESPEGLEQVELP